MSVKIELNNNNICNEELSDISDILDKKYELSLLYDYYGELLKDNHRRIFGYYVLDDMSLGEISSELGITRQAVYDSIKRSTAHLKEYEAKLSLIAGSRQIRIYCNDIINQLNDCDVDQSVICSISKTLNKILEV